MEMNTRLQVEHPVTEAITGLDLVELQFRVAGGEQLPFSAVRSRDRRPCRRGAALRRGSGKGLPAVDRQAVGAAVSRGAGLRIDTGVAEGDAVTPFYDPMIAKVIAHAPSRLRRWTGWPRRWARRSWPGRAPMSRSSRRSARRAEFPRGRVRHRLHRPATWMRSAPSRAGSTLAPPPLEPWRWCASAKPPRTAVPRSARARRRRRRGMSPTRSRLSGPRRSGLALLVEGERVDADARLGRGRAVAGHDRRRGGRATASGSSRWSQTDEGIIALSDGRQTAVRLFDPLSVVARRGRRRRAS